MSDLWIIQHNYAPNYGGASRRIQELCWAMQEKGLNVKVFSARSLDYSESGNYDNVKVIILSNNILSIIGRWKFILRFIVQLLISKKKPLAIHINAPLIEEGLIVLLCKIIKVRVVLQLTLEGQDDPYSMSKGRKYPNLLVKLFMKLLYLAEAVLCLSPAIVNLCRSFGWKGEKIIWTPHAKDTCLFSPVRSSRERDEIRQKFCLPTDKIIFGFVGNLSDRKGFGELVVAWKRIYSERKDIHLALVGDIPVNERVWTNNLLKSLPFSSFSYLGLLSREAVADFLRVLDFFVLPSKREGMSGALVEAILSDIPCITTHLRGVTDLVIKDGETGILCKDGSDNLYLSLINATKRYCSEQALVGGRNLVINYFDKDIIYPHYHELYIRGKSCFPHFVRKKRQADFPIWREDK